MIFEGDTAVIQAIREKRRLMETSQPHDHIRPLLIQGGGLMRGAYGVGTALALEEMGYTNSFSALVGISSGAPIVSHFAAGSTKKGLSVLQDVCCHPDFLRLARFWNQVDTKRFMDAMRYDERTNIDVTEALANPAALYFGVTEYKTARPQLLKPRNEEHFFQSMHASINMQNISPYRIIIDGVHYNDGGFSKPHMITKAIEEIDATHVLIVTNNEHQFDPIPWWEKLLNRTLFRLRLNGALAHAINSRREARDAAIADALAGELKVAVVWGDGSISDLEKNAEKIAATVEASRTWWYGLMASVDE